MIPSYLVQRIAQLENNIKKDYELLNRIEAALRVEDSPKRQAKYELDIAELKASAGRYEKEYQELLAKVSPQQTSQLQNIQVELQKMDTKLDLVIASQAAIYKHLDNMQQELLARYELGERELVATLFEKLDQDKLILIRAMIEGLDANLITQQETQQLLTTVQSSMVALEQQNVAIPVNQLLEDAIKDPSLDVRHRLKICLPIIPLILQYEGELEIGSGTNLGNLWKQLVAKVHGA
ncbi:MAG: hypothetical protein AB1489_30270 [Acidobacteriota bacterium]